MELLQRAVQAGRPQYFLQGVCHLLDEIFPWELSCRTHLSHDAEFDRSCKPLILLLLFNYSLIIICSQDSLELFLDMKSYLCFQFPEHLSEIVMFFLLQAYLKGCNVIMLIQVIEQAQFNKNTILS